MNDATKVTVEYLTTQLVDLLSTDEPEYLEVYDDNPENWQAATARSIAHRILRAANADSLGGCKLCQG
mgnify:CR=1 FL=1